MAKQFEGIYAALMTPMDENECVNGVIAQKLVEKQLAMGVKGFYLCGSTGESYLLSMEERTYLLEAVMEAARGRAEVMVNVGMFYTEHSIELARHAQRQGVDAISSVPPFYFPFNSEEYVRYYDDLAESVEVPVVVYNIPNMSAVKFSTEELCRFLENDKITGIKHTSFDLFQMQQLLARYPEKTIFIGHDELFLSALAIGAKAGIGSTYNIMGDKFVNMQALYRAGRTEEALEVQNQVNEVVDALCKVGIFKGIKAVLHMQGLDCGNCRRPFLPLKDEELSILQAVAEKNGLL